MKVEIHLGAIEVHIHHPPSADVDRRLATLERAVESLKRQDTRTMATIQETREEMRRLRSAGDALRVKFDALRDELASRGIDQALLDEVFAEAKAEADADIAAINENTTPSAPAPETPPAA